MALHREDFLLSMLLVLAVRLTRFSLRVRSGVATQMAQHSGWADGFVLNDWQLSGRDHAAPAADAIIQAGYSNILYIVNIP